MVGLKPCGEPLNDFCLMIRARYNPTVSEWYHGLGCSILCVPTAMATDTTSGVVMQEFRRIFGGEPADPREEDL